MKSHLPSFLFIVSSTKISDQRIELNDQNKRLIHLAEKSNDKNLNTDTTTNTTTTNTTTGHALAIKNSTTPLNVSNPYPNASNVFGNFSKA